MATPIQLEAEQEKYRRHWRRRLDRTMRQIVVSRTQKFSEVNCRHFTFAGRMPASRQRVDGSALEELTINERGLRAHLKRGDSSLHVTTETPLSQWRAAVMKWSGVVHLGDVAGISNGSDAMIDGRVDVDGEYDIAHRAVRIFQNAASVRLLHPVWAMVPFHLPKISTRSRLSWTGDKEGAALTGQLSIGDLKTDFTLDTSEFGDRFQFDWWSRPIDCNELISGVPREWLSNMSLSFAGKAEPRLTMSGRRSEPETIKFRLRGLLGVCRVARISVPWDTSGISIPSKDGQYESVTSDADVDVLNRSFIKRIHPSYTQDVAIDKLYATILVARRHAAYVSGVMFLSEEMDLQKLRG